PGAIARRCLAALAHACHAIGTGCGWLRRLANAPHHPEARHERTPPERLGCRRSVMHAVIRNYSGKGTEGLFDLLEKNKGEVESLIRGVKGFVSYSLVRTTRGGFSVSVYQDKAGADESTRAAREWIAKNASKTGVARPTILEGTVIVQLK